MICREADRIDGDLGSYYSSESWIESMIDNVRIDEGERMMRLNVSRLGWVIARLQRQFRATMRRKYELKLLLALRLQLLVRLNRRSKAAILIQKRFRKLMCFKSTTVIFRYFLLLTYVSQLSSTPNKTLNLTEEESVLVNGAVLIKRGAASSWPFYEISCDELVTELIKMNFSATPAYASNNSPLYFAAKEYKEARKYVAGNVKPFPFLANNWFMSISPEFWITNSKGSSALPHLDGHVEITVAIQLSGVRKWTLGSSNEQMGKSLRLGYHYADGDEFQWKTETEVILEPGDAIFFPPGLIHATENVGDTCAVSLTMQLTYPGLVPSKYLKKNMKWIRRTGDINELWIVLLQLGSLGYLAPSKEMDSKLFSSYSAIPDFPFNIHNAPLFFRHIFLNFWERGNLVGPFMSFPFLPRDFVLFHDLNEDGVLTEEEYVSSALDWLGLELQVFSETPKSLWLFHYFRSDAYSDLNFLKEELLAFENKTKLTDLFK